MKYCLAIVAALLLAGCAKNIDTEDAVKQSVIKDISSKVDISAMDIEVVAVSFRDKEADAQISFKPKGNTGQGIIMRYALQRSGDEWKVAQRSMETKHDEAADAPGNAAPGQGDSGSALPPGHPSTTGQLPPGHPTVDPSAK